MVKWGSMSTSLPLICT